MSETDSMLRLVRLLELFNAATGSMSCMATSTGGSCRFPQPFGLSERAEISGILLDLVRASTERRPDFTSEKLTRLSRLCLCREHTCEDHHSPRMVAAWLMSGQSSN
jgi:hypothetical protein